MHRSSSTGQSDRMLHALAGGWVADSASLGLHWLYSSPRILEVGGDCPEFLEPTADYFEGVFGYFAHEGKRAGDTSHYAAATDVLTQSLLANHGRLDIRDYQRRFRLFFGPGGQWQGFIDNPTRITLENFNTIEQNAIDRALATTTAELTERQKRVLVQKVMPYTRRLSGDELAQPVRDAINLTYQESDIQDAGVHIAQTIDQHLLPASGADDLQLPAVSKIAPIVACYSGSRELMDIVEAAVRVTNHNDEAVAWAKCAATLLDSLCRGESMEAALDQAMPEAPDSESMTKARSTSSLNAVDAGDIFGRTCYLHEAMPVIFHILTHARSFAEAVRSNIQCGGDSCGRAWVIGPALAAMYGVGGDQGIPLSWLARLHNGAAILSDVEQLLARH